MSQGLMYMKIAHTYGITYIEFRMCRILRNCSIVGNILFSGTTFWFLVSSHLEYIVHKDQIILFHNLKHATSITMNLCTYNNIYNIQIDPNAYIIFTSNSMLPTPCISNQCVITDFDQSYHFQWLIWCVKMHKY